MFYHPVLVWKACYTSFAAVLCKPTSRTELNVSISSPSSEGGGLEEVSLWKMNTTYVSISSPSSEGGGWVQEISREEVLPNLVSISSPSSEGGGRRKV